MLGLIIEQVAGQDYFFWHTSVYRGIQGEHWLLLCPPGILYRSWRGEYHIPWQQVQRIEQDAYNIYFLLKCKGPLGGYRFNQRMPLFLNRVCTVPKGAFGHPLNAAAFVDAATAQRGNALHGRAWAASWAELAFSSSRLPPLCW